MEEGMVEPTRATPSLIESVVEAGETAKRAWDLANRIHGEVMFLTSGGSATSDDKEPKKEPNGPLDALRLLLNEINSALECSNERLAVLEKQLGR